MKTCEIDNCIKPYKAKGMCAMHWRRNKIYGNPKKLLKVNMYSSIDEKFLDCIEPITESGCWIWTEPLSDDGYGVLAFKGLKISAHRYSYKKFNGLIPDNMCVLHLCDIRCCVNPFHLFIGSKLDNNRDRHNKGRSASLKGSKNPFAKLDEEKVLNIKNLLNNAYKLQYIAALYNVDKTTISQIKRNNTWKHVKGEIIGQ